MLKGVFETLVSIFEIHKWEKNVVLKTIGATLAVAFPVCSTSEKFANQGLKKNSNTKT